MKEKVQEIFLKRRPLWKFDWFWESSPSSQSCRDGEIHEEEIMDIPLRVWGRLAWFGRYKEKVKGKQVLIIKEPKLAKKSTKIKYSKLGVIGW